ncbi:cuticle protein 8-like [Eriocheir sinensis]|uniref:cuticle protein 8-like n=1 Tax=Eriocheir sinensis TaxID=95602 RepID=UPI0021C7C88D|nr:cuticle protein 8-like [Eriocheir sinensis]
MSLKINKLAVCVFLFVSYVCVDLSGRSLVVSFQVSLLVVVCVVGASLADQVPVYHEPPQYIPPSPSYAAPAPSYHPVEDYPDSPPQYKYNYGVADGYTGASYGHSESRDGYKTEGSYTVDLPDGRTQIVNYVDNGDGLEAVVTYEGEAQYPEHQSSYPAPPPEPAYAEPPVEPAYPAPPPPEPPVYPA